MKQIMCSIYIKVLMVPLVCRFGELVEDKIRLFLINNLKWKIVSVL